METTVINATEYRDLPLSQLNESKTNPRRVFDNAALQELAESIRSQGFFRLCSFAHSPRTVSRSWRDAALPRAQMAEQETVPVRIKNLTDAEVIEAQLVENLIRAEIHRWKRPRFRPAFGVG